MIPLGDLPGGSYYSWAMGINDLDEVVGRSRGVFSGMYAFIWDAQNGMRSLGDLPGGQHYSSALDINNASQVVGWSVSTRASFGEAFIWDAVNGMRPLPDIPGGGIAHEANAINDLGQVTGNAATPRGDYTYLWDPNDGYTIIGTLPGAQASSSGLGLNDRGEIVGSCLNPAGKRTAFVWDRRRGIRDLGLLLDAYTDPRALPLDHANGINNAGQIIAFPQWYGIGMVLTPYTLADMNCDGSVNAFDIDGFVLSLGAALGDEGDAARFRERYGPDCHGDWAADVNQDGSVNTFDIAAFIEAIGC